MGQTADAESIFGRYSSARDLFEACYQAAIEVQSYGSKVAQMEARDGVHAQRYDRPMVHGSSCNDARAATDDRMDFESAMRSVIDQDRKLMDAARMLIHGDGSRGVTGGVMVLCGLDASIVLYERYVLASTWETAASRAMVSVKTAHRLADEAMDVIDSHGWTRTVKGEGMAEG